MYKPETKCKKIFTKIKRFFSSSKCTAKREMSSDLKAQIAKRAYELYEQRGRQEGYELQDWLQAEREICKDKFCK